jgi:glycosyltransferase involved in cell wall biosynthesis
MDLLFVHGAERLKEDNLSNLYTDGSYSNESWERYLSISSKLSTIFRKEENIYEAEHAKQKFQWFNKNRINFIEIPDLTASISSFLSIKKRKMTTTIIKEAVLEHDCLIARLPSDSGNVAIKFARKYHKPYLIELVGCPWDALWNHSWKGKLVAPFMWYATKKAVKNAPYVLYVTNEFLQHRYPTTGKTTGCSNVELLALNESVLEARLHKIKQMTKHKPIVLGTTAAIDVRYKGQEYVIQAITELNKQGYDFEYHLVGGGDKARLQSLAEKYRVADKVIFEGSIPHEKVFDYLDNIDIYVQPSLTEGLPRALIEAMSRGCPCIGSNVGGIPELLDKPSIFNSGNVKELANILANLDKEMMIAEAKRNYEFSKGYAKEVIETRRNDFLKEFAKTLINK